MGTTSTPPSDALILLNPGTHPAEALVWVAGRSMRVRLFPEPTPDSFPPGPARDAVQALQARRPELLSDWGASAPAGEPFSKARAVRVMPLAGGRWCFELAGGVALAVPASFLPGLSNTRLTSPVAIEGGCWWLWPDVPVAVDVGALVAALGQGAEQVRPLVVKRLVTEKPKPPEANEEATEAAQQRTAEAGPPPAEGVAAPAPEPVATTMAAEARGAGGGEPPASAVEPQPGERAPAPEPPVGDGAPTQAPSPDATLTPSAESGSASARRRAEAALGVGADGEAIDRRTRIHSASVQGLILLNGDFVTEEEYAKINNEQARRKDNGQTSALGQVAVEMGYVTAEQLRFVMALGRRLNPKVNEPKSLALFLLEHNVIRPSALNAALDRAEESKTPLDAVLVEMNLISSSALRTFVDIHARFSPRV
ncbi:MAG: hypothetical protein VKS61_18710 [Candidatus Sericytochromatia bacterium]|nr:hypothetical protein [Candidatus Sericytochromatia bacterium]